MRRNLLVLPLLTLALTACRDDAPAAIDLLTLVPEGSSQVVLQQEPGPTPGTLTYVVRVLSRGPKLASVQGTVAFTPGTLELLGTTTPSAAGDGEAYLVNATPAQGMIRFAAFTPETFGTDEVFRFTVRERASLEAIAFRAEIDAAGEAAGTALETKTFRSADGVRDRQGRLLRQ